MDRNSATGLVLISALILVYLFFFSPKTADVEKARKQEAAAATAKTGAKPASATAVAAVPALAPDAPLDSAAGPVRDATLQNANLTVTFSTRGGRVTAVRLNKYKTFFGSHWT